jgi:DNA repair protein SbcD/Mre11
VVRARGPAIVYPGNLQGRHARECGAKGAYLATVNDQLELAALQFHALDAVRWERIELTIDPEHDAEAVLAAAAERVGPLQDSAGDRPLMLRVVLTGPGRAHEVFQADPHTWRERLAEHVRNAVPEAWLEDVRFRTMPRHEARDDGWGDIGDALAAALESLRADPAALQAIIDGPLDDLVKKVNPLLNDGPEPLRLRDPSWLAEHLDRVLPTLRSAAGGAP